MTVETALAAAADKMDKAIAVLKDELSGVRTGRATPALLQRIVVDYYGTPVPIQQLASFSVPEPRTLVITPFDRNAISSMEKAIMSSDLGITPGNDGTVIAPIVTTLAWLTAGTVWFGAIVGLLTAAWRAV